MSEIERVSELLKNELNSIETSTIANSVSIQENIRKEMNAYVKMNAYMTWLSDFLLVNDLATDSLLTMQPTLSDDDYENISHLGNLFYVISEYADNNYFYPQEDGYSTSYDIKFRDSFYTIGLNSGQGSYTFAYKKDISDRYIDFDYIIQDKELPDKKYIECELDLFSTRLRDLLDKKIPVEALQERFIDACKEQKTKVRK